MGVQGDQPQAAADRQVAAGIEAEPAHPENEAAQRHQPEVMPGNHARRAIGGETPQARPEHQDSGQRAPGANAVHHGGPGEVDEPQLGQPALATVHPAPYPAAEYRVDDATDQQRTDQVGAIARTLGHRTAGDGGGGRGEHHLEQQEGVIPGFGLVQREVTHAEPAGEVGAEHQAEAQQPEHDAADAAVHVVLHHHVDRVLGPRHAALQQREARLHEEHQHAGQHQPGRIGRLLRGGMGLRGEADGDEQQHECFHHEPPSDRCPDFATLVPASSAKGCRASAGTGPTNGQGDQGPQVRQNRTDIKQGVMPMASIRTRTVPYGIKSATRHDGPLTARTRLPILSSD